MAVAVDPQYVGQLGEIVLRPAANRRALTDFFSIKEGIKGKQIVTFLERGGLATILDPGCGGGITNLAMGQSQATWDPFDMKAWISECWTGLRGKVYEHGLKAGNDKKDLTDTDYGDYMVDLLEDIVGADLLRMAYFADPTFTAANFTASVTLGGNTYTAAQLVPFFKTFPGAFRRITQAVGAGTIGAYVPITQNDPAGAQTINYETEILPLFRSIFNAATAELSAQPLANQRLFVTLPLYNAWVDYRESRNLDLAYQAQADGIPRPTYRNVAIVPMAEWTQTLNTFFKPSTLSGKVDKPLRAVLTAVGNFQLGFDANPINDRGRADLEVWTSLDTEKWNARATYTADEQLADPKLVVAAY